MIGTIIGDYAGSVVEFSNNRDYNVTLFHPDNHFTDDTIHTCGMARVLTRLNAMTDDINDLVPFLASDAYKADDYAQELVDISLSYADGGYGGRFREWYLSGALTGQFRPPYNSFGNGSAMRTSPLAFLKYESLEQMREVAAKFSSVTHNHEEGIKGAQCTTEIIMASTYRAPAKDAIDIANYYGYEILDMDVLRKYHVFNETCQGTVPAAISCFVHSDSFESCIRNCISIGGDADTLGAIAGPMAYEYYKWQRNPITNRLKSAALGKLSPELLQIVKDFYLMVG